MKRNEEVLRHLLNEELIEVLRIRVEALRAHAFVPNSEIIFLPGDDQSDALALSFALDSSQYPLISGILEVPTLRVVADEVREVSPPLMSERLVDAVQVDRFLDLERHDVEELADGKM